MKLSPISVRLSPIEKAQLLEIASREGLSLSDAMRDLLRKNLSLQTVIHCLNRLENEIGVIAENHDPTPALEAIADALNGIRSDILHAQKTYLNSAFNRLCLTEMMRQMNRLDDINSQFDKLKITRGITE